MSTAVHDFGWCTLPRVAQLYVTATVATGAVALIALFPQTWPDPVLFVLLIVASCLTSAWKVNLPIALASGSTLSVSYAADLTALLLLGPGPAVIVALAGAWTQCTFKVRQREPLHRTAFSLGAIAITMWATGLAYVALGGVLAPHNFSGLPKPLLGAIATYFVVNTGLIAVAIAVSTRQSAWKIWHRDFLWSGTAFVVAATAGAAAAIVIARGSHWEALLMIAPVYLIYRTYETMIGRLEDQRRHLEETHRLHDEAVIALAQARKAERRDLMADVAHELRTPLSVLQGRLEGLIDGVYPRDDGQLSRLLEETHVLSRLIEDLRTLALSDAGVLKLQKEPTDLAGLLRDVVGSLETEAGGRSVSLTVASRVDDLTADVDPVRIREVFTNLLSNALRHTPADGTVTLSVEGAGDAVAITVDDTGEGMPAEEVARIFDRFYKGAASRGSGLGLTIAKSLVTAHGGQISAASTVGEGTTLRVTLPSRHDE